MVIRALCPVHEGVLAKHMRGLIFQHIDMSRFLFCITCIITGGRSKGCFLLRRKGYDFGWRKKGAREICGHFPLFWGTEWQVEQFVHSCFSMSGREQTCMWKGRGPFCSLSQRNTWTRPGQMVGEQLLYANHPLFYFPYQCLCCYFGLLLLFAVNGSYLYSGSLPFVSSIGLSGGSSMGLNFHLDLHKNTSHLSPRLDGSCNWFSAWFFAAEILHRNELYWYIWLSAKNKTYYLK